VRIVSTPRAQADLLIWVARDVSTSRRTLHNLDSLSRRLLLLKALVWSYTERKVLGCSMHFAGA
jgi:hypothetical protein